MSLSSKIRHSFIGWCIRKIIHVSYNIRYKKGEPVTYQLPHGVTMNLWPKGEIAEFLWLGWLFEKTELTLVGDLIKPNMNIIDVGANIGLYSIYAAKLTNNQTNIWSFEPSRKTASLLTQNITLNECEDVINIYEVALSNKESSSLLASDSGYGDAYSYLLSSDKKDTKHEHSETVEVTTLDSWISRNNINKIDFLKVDIEGGEYLFFQGAEKTLKTNNNIVIMFENEDDWCKRLGHSQEDSILFLKSLGFGIYTWDKKNKKWSELDSDILRSNILWACRNYNLLPKTNNKTE
ncbi:MAG: FkbM family methyltransferase [Rickettsiales bacterium]